MHGGPERIRAVTIANADLELTEPASVGFLGEMTA